MAKWEYKKLTSNDALESENAYSEVEWLDQLGAAGWELVTVLGNDEESREFYFKRPKQQKNFHTM